MLYSRVHCAKVGSYYQTFLAVNENLVDRKQGVRFCQFLVCGLAKYIEIHQTAHFKHTKPHTLFPINGFHSLLETLDNKNGQLLQNGRVNKAYIFVISWAFIGTNLQFALLSQLFLCNREPFADRNRLQTTGVIKRINPVFLITFDLNIWSLSNLHKKQFRLLEL